MIEARLKTKRSRDYLWSRINSPKKMVKIEDFDRDSKITKISDNNYELISDEYEAILTFIPKKAVNITFFRQRNCPLAWFEIKGERDCIITHGAYKRIDSGKGKAALKKEFSRMKEHFLEELEDIAR